MHCLHARLYVVECVERPLAPSFTTKLQPPSPLSLLIRSFVKLLDPNQGRLPIRVELRGLNKADFRRILTEPEYNLIRQQQVRIAVLARQMTTRVS